jgi:hypothetical protein
VGAGASKSRRRRVDKITLGVVEDYGVDRVLRELRMRENRTYGLKGGWGNRAAQQNRRPRLPMAEPH